MIQMSYLGKTTSQNDFSSKRVNLSPFTKDFRGEEPYQ